MEDRNQLTPPNNEQLQEPQPVQESNNSSGQGDGVIGDILDEVTGGDGFDLMETVTEGASATLEKVGEVAESAVEAVSDAAEAVSSFIKGIFD